MSTSHRQRSLWNVRLTRAFHYRYMGLWIVLTIFLVLLFNVFFHLLVKERWLSLRPSATDADAAFALVARPLLIAQAIEVVLFSVAIVGLAKLTSHRIAGPYLQLRRICAEVRGGDLDSRLRFRRSDRLADLEAEFNAMLEALKARIGAADRPGEGSRQGP